MNYAYKLMIASLATLILSESAMAVQTCASRSKILEISAGDVRRPYGADGGNAVYLIMDNGRALPINNSLNLNDTPGESILAIALTAVKLELPVTLIDHRGTGCDDFDEILLHTY